MAADLTDEKRAAAEAAAALVPHGATVGLGTGTTVAFLLPALAARALDLRCVATSNQTETAARALGLHVEPFTQLDRLDVAIDGTDQVTADGWLIKGGGGAHVREKVVAAAAKRFIVIASSDKVVDRLRPPVPLELMAFGLPATLQRLGDAVVREAPHSPDGGVIADAQAPFDDPREHAAWLASVPGVIGHGIFAPELVSEVLVARGDDVERFFVRG
jgi:ribose 5-phosphate isomerase A